MWGTNARNAHPIFFHHVLKGISNGARSWTVDPRRTGTAKFTDSWLGLDVGTDIALAHGVARENIHASLTAAEFIRNATTSYEESAAFVESWTLQRHAQVPTHSTEPTAARAPSSASPPTAQSHWTLTIR